VVLYSIGYSTRTIAEFIQLLQKHNIEYLIDVRTQSYSKRFPDFKKQTIEKFLANHNIRYVFLGDSLGGRPQDPDCYDKDGKVDDAKCERKSIYQSGLQRIKSAYEQGFNSALMCSEIKPETCHRTN
jgi:uncharacterized protein (DUF488 family)